jgi:hypothetical protein
VNAVMNLRVPFNAGNLPSGCTTCFLLSGTQLQTGLDLLALIIHFLNQFWIAARSICSFYEAALPVSCTAIS